MHVHLCGFQITQYVNAPTTMILPITVDTAHGLNCIGHVIYRLQTGTYIAKHLTHPMKLLMGKKEEWFYYQQGHRDNIIVMEKEIFRNACHMTNISNPTILNVRQRERERERERERRSK